MKVKVKKLADNAVIPKYANIDDAGLDLTATSIEVLNNQQVVYGTGLAFQLPKGHVGLLFPRSSIYKTVSMLANSVGVLDASYTGEVKLIFNYGYKDKLYKVGDRIGQLIVVPYPSIELDEVEELEDTDRGNAGFGSTGN